MPATALRIPCTCRGYDPADPCGHGDVATDCPRHDPQARQDWLAEHAPGAVRDGATPAQRTAARNLACEVRAVEEGHHCRVDRERGVLVVVSDSRPWQYAVEARAVDGLVVFGCVAEHKPGEPDVVIPGAYQWHARHSGPGRTGCKHQALVARRLQREGLVRLVAGQWYATERAEELAPPRYVLLSTGPKSHYAKDTVTNDLGGMFRTKRAAREAVDRRNAP